MLTLAKPGSAVRFVLLPMLHLGSPAFYRAVRRRLQAVVRPSRGRATRC